MSIGPLIHSRWFQTHLRYLCLLQSKPLIRHILVVPNLCIIMTIFAFCKWLRTAQGFSEFWFAWGEIDFRMSAVTKFVGKLYLKRYFIAKVADYVSTSHTYLFSNQVSIQTSYTPRQVDRYHQWIEKRICRLARSYR